jgi:hypothetical protein
MNFSPEKGGYFNKTGEEIDFSEKRFQFWMESIPPDLRRLEHDLLKGQRELLNSTLYRHDNTKKVGRFTVLPAFTDEIREASWEDFQDSFLWGEERKERFAQIIEQARIDLPELMEKHSKIIPKDKIKLIALGGSSIYGPRQEGERLSDVDLNFLIDEKTDKLNFQSLPDIHKPDEIPYHLFGTGYGDKARGNRRMHWMLCPHFPLENNLSQEELEKIISNLLTATEKRKLEIQKYMGSIDSRLKERGEAEIQG